MVTENMNNTIDIHTGAAKELLKQNGYTCVLYSQNTICHSSLRGVRPLLDFLESGKDFRGFCAADKTVGLGAAHLYILLGISALWANVISETAADLLRQHNIHVYCENTVPFIINREGTGPCPIESAVQGITDSVQALNTIKEAIRKLQK